VLNRERNLTKIKVGIAIALFFQVGLPITLTLFFDHEFIYLSLVGFLFGGIIWYFREKIEIQLLILNGIGAILWLFVSLGELMNI
jgi:ABC-type Mn2+/Zn2+ transport system permease subunit